MNSQPVGRPTDYTTEIAEAICERIADGEKLIGIVRDTAMPCRRTVFRWLNEHPEFAAMYRLARTYQAEFWSEEMIEIAFNDSGDVLIERLEKTKAGAVTVVEKPVSNNVRVRRDQLKIETLRTAIAQALPTKYGKLAGADDALIGTPPTVPTVKKADISPLSAAVIAFERKRGTAKKDAPARREVQDRGQ